MKSFLRRLLSSFAFLVVAVMASQSAARADMICDRFLIPGTLESFKNDPIIKAMLNKNGHNGRHWDEKDFLNSDVFKRVPIKSLQDGTLEDQVLMVTLYDQDFKPYNQHDDGKKRSKLPSTFFFFYDKVAQRYSVIHQYIHNGEYDGWSFYTIPLSPISVKTRNVGSKSEERVIEFSDKDDLLFSGSTRFLGNGFEDLTDSQRAASFFSRNFEHQGDKAPFASIQVLDRTSVLNHLPEVAAYLAKPKSILENYRIDSDQYVAVPLSSISLPEFEGAKIQDAMLEISFYEKLSDGTYSTELDSKEIVKKEFIKEDNENVLIFWDTRSNYESWPSKTRFDEYDASRVDQLDGSFLVKKDDGDYLLLINAESRNYFRLRAEYDLSSNAFEGTVTHEDEESETGEKEYRVIVRLLAPKTN